MAGAFKFTKHISMLRRSATLLSAAVVTAATATGVSKSKHNVDGKDQILFLSREDNAVPSTALIPQQEISENRDPLLPDGSLNWGCSCIEKDVIGPCNIEFRHLRQFMHVNDIKDDMEAFTAETRAEFDKLFEAYIICTMDNPVYYKDMMLDEEKEDLERQERQKKEQTQKKRLEREKNTRDFGKDKVVFLTKEENSLPRKIVIPQVQVEENRSPVLPNGDINWACTCIEKDVIGPCNIEFRQFRQFVHDNRHRKEDAEMTQDERNIIGNFIACIKQNPVYYASFFSKDEDDEEVLNGDSYSNSNGDNTTRN